MEKMQKHLRPVPLKATVLRYPAIAHRATEASRDIAIIERARELIGDVSHWTRLKLAEDNNGESVEWSSPRAEKFCAVGALQRAAFELTGNVERAISAVENLQKKMYRPSTETLPKLMTVNDSQGHPAVLEKFDSTLHTLKTGKEPRHD